MGVTSWDIIKKYFRYNKKKENLHCTTGDKMNVSDIKADIMTESV